LSCSLALRSIASAFAFASATYTAPARTRDRCSPPAPCAARLFVVRGHRRSPGTRGSPQRPSPAAPAPSEGPLVRDVRCRVEGTAGRTRSKYRPSSSMVTLPSAALDLHELLQHRDRGVVLAGRWPGRVRGSVRDRSNQRRHAREIPTVRYYRSRRLGSGLVRAAGTPSGSDACRISPMCCSGPRPSA
jgi:hypothetical protein